MENNKNTTNEDCVCEKIHKAIWRNSTVRENPKLDQKTPKSQAASSEVPVVFNTPVLPVPPKEKEHATKTTGQEVKVPSKTEPIKTRVVPNYDTGPEDIVFRVKPKTEGKPLVHNNDGGEAKIRTTSNVGGGRGRESVARLDSMDVKVGDYIKLTKTKIKTMSGIGGGRTTRTTSNVGGGRGRESVARLDSMDVKVGDYIKRTKMKIRTMSGIGGGRTLSIK